MSEVTIYLVPYYYTCCPQSHRPYCLNYTNTSGELAVTRFTYNRKGLNDKAFYQQISGHRSSHNSHEFNKAGQMVRKYRKYNDGETSEEVFTYDKSGRLLVESFASSNGQKGTARYEYDSTGNAVRMVCDGYKGWFEGTVLFDFDQDGKRLSGRLFRESEAVGGIAYAYDREGNLVKEDWSIGDGGWSQTLLYVYEPIDAD